MKFEKDRLINHMIEFGKEVYTKGLVWGNSGNISCRLNNHKFVISGSITYLGKLQPKDFVVFNWKNSEWEGKAKPSIETKMHTEIYRLREDINSVFHSQPFFTTLISCTDLDVDNKLFPESIAYISKIGRVPYLHPGSHELAKAVATKAKDCDMIILSNHGVICAAKDLEDALLKTETLEMLCKLITFEKIGDIKLNWLPENMRKELLRHLKKLK